MQEESIKLVNRRQHERLKSDCKLCFGAFWDLPKVTWEKEGDIIDIGGGGVRFLTSETVKQGTQLIMVMGFPGWLAEEDEWTESKSRADIGVLKVIGEVLRVEPSAREEGKYEVAVRFSGRIRL